MNYFVVNLDNGEFWEGEAENAREAYKHITIKNGDTTSIRFGRLSIVKIWNEDNMEKYSKEWKKAQGKGWIQKHGDIYKIHYIEHDTEYSTGEHFTAKSAREALKNY